MSGGRGTLMAASPGGGVAAAGLPDLLSLVASLDTTLLPCLPARELQAADRSTHPSHQVDVERHAAEFMEAAKTLKLFFIRAQHQHRTTREKALRKEISELEMELKVKDAVLEKQNKLLQSWQFRLEDEKDKHNGGLERV